MKNNKGFTLVEVLAVVAILITIIAIITPKIFKQFKTAENITEQEQINSLINIAKLYTNQNTNKLPEQNKISIITLQELKQSGLMQTNQILNPKTKQELTGCITVKYEDNKYKYEYEEDGCNKVITVTFDPQGGQLSQTTKEVISGQNYGILPTPTKEGYTFMGWNGKNMFELKENVDWKLSGEISTNSVENSITLIGENWVLAEYYLPILKKNTNYSISGYIELINSDSTYVRITKERAKTNNNTFLLNMTTVNNGYFNSSFTINDSDETTAALALYGNLGNSDEKGVKISNIQLEEGDTATPYEPYYITSNTTVVQEQNHTLKAIWQAN